MSQFFEIHPTTPQPRLVKQAVAIIRDGGVIAYPTDSCYALGCHIDNKPGMEKIARIRHIDKEHNFTLMCSDLSEISTYARVDNWAFRLLKAHTPGPYTFILQASSSLPRRLQNPKKKTIGIRVPEHPVAKALLDELGEPLMTSTLMLKGDIIPYTEGWEIREALEHELDLIIDGGPCGIVPTTVVDLVGGAVELVREGRGDASVFQ
ncbi:MAG: L-threonylcarbamoyladenylate synthase [Gammaproteobacteria bacterium]|nr:L-threonylcarbamoyladenylate synthase [Gammaproteobacteria bacterium]